MIRHRGTGINVGEIEEEIRCTQSAINGLQTEIKQVEREVASLERQKRELNSLISQYERDISSRKSKHTSYQSDINNAQRVQRQIGSVKGQAASTRVSVQEVERELQQAKVKLDQCSAMVNNQSLELQTKSSFVDRLVTQDRRHAREFRRQKELLEKVVGALDSIHAQIPGLPPVQETKFLKAGGGMRTEQRDSQVYGTSEVGSSVPAICFRST